MAHYNEVDPNQESLIDVAFLPSGMTEPEGYNPTIVLSIADVALPEFEPVQTKEAILDPVEVVEAIESAAEARLRHSRAQTGKHSALQPNGEHSNVLPGKFLPGFGPVTYRNYAVARQYAARLDASHRARRNRTTS